MRWSVLFFLFAFPLSAAEKPNVVFILADDIGYGDVACYGGKVSTPNLDKLASQGMKFSHAYAPSAMCSPTRYSLMTGEWAFRSPAVARGVLTGVAPLCIAPGRFTTPAMMQKAGYATAAVGKWHLGLGDPVPDFNKEIKPGPNDIGFDYFFGLPATNDRTPCVLIENRKVVGLDPNDPIKVTYGPKDQTDPDTFAAKPDTKLRMYPSQGHDQTVVNGISRIGQMTGGKAARWVDEDLADRFTGKAVDFIERNKAKPFFLYFATADIHVPRTPHARFVGKSGRGPRGDCLIEFDWCVGQLLETLERNKLTDNTLVVFTSDNGGVIDDGYKDEALAKMDGHKLNGSLRGFKAGLYEGGSRVPMVVRWPGKVKAGSQSDVIINSMDTMATLAAVVGAEVPKDAGRDSLNQLPVFLGTATKPIRDIEIMHAGSGALAIRHGDWKLIPNDGMKKKGGPELYNLKDDPAEEKNLAAAKPEKVTELRELLAKIKG